jgi:flagellar hook assembly protein FlgD
MEPAQVSLKIYDILGQEVATLANENLKAGVYNATWDARNSAGTKVVSGTYFCRLAAGNHVISRKMLLLR